MKRRPYSFTPELSLITPPKEATQEALAAAIHEAMGMRDADRRIGAEDPAAEAAGANTADLFNDERPLAGRNGADC